MDDVIGNFIMGFLIGTVLVGVFKVGWFLLWMTWYLSAFVVLSIGAGIGAVMRRGQGDRDIPGSGRYSDDGMRWVDRASGTSYAVNRSEQDVCIVEVGERGF